MTASNFGGLVPRQRLADGNEIPTLALGVWQVREGKECFDAVRWALELGYRHIDTAQAYGNETSVGKRSRRATRARRRLCYDEVPSRSSRSGR